MTITFNQFIKDGDFLISKNEAFVLGFFSPGTSSNRYVGIWYKFSQNKVLWVANRDHPVNDTSGILTISTEGNLVLHYNTSQSLPLRSTNVSVTPMSSSNSTKVQLQDSGNLVLVNQQVHNQSGVLWQSSNHPTHILLASMKIGFQQGYEPNSPEEWRLREGSGGCKRLQGAPSMCRNGERFVKIQNVKVPDSSTINLDINLTMEACEQKCLNNCSCLAYAGADVRNGRSGCMTWYGDLMDTTQFAQGQGQDLYIRADAIVSGSLMKQYGSIAHKDLEYFNLKSILAATDNLSIANKLGEGGFGPVYKGLLANGEEIAVQRLSKNSGQGLEQFKTEVKLIAKLQHRNLVRLLGCCFNSEDKMLIYEYLPNKSLDFFIFDRSRSLSIDWKKRFDIINGIARGVLYPHQDSILKIVHRDIKASNVLLDSQ
ncbi:hypothetical protein ACLB2K_033147 [Fragaria x ananassa]